MTTSIVDMALQFTMAAGLLSIVALLIMPFLPFFQNNSSPCSDRVVLEISDSLSGNQQGVIARAKVLADKRPGSLVELVATSKGISLLIGSSIYKQDILLLMSKGVSFTICRRSLQELEHKIGHSIELVPGVRLASDGHAYAEDLKENGYIDELV